MATDVSLKQIVSSLTYFFEQNFAASTTVWYPGCRIDRQSLDDWVEFRVSHADRPPQRKANQDRFELLLRLRIVAKSVSNIYRVWRIHTEAAVNLLMHAQIAITNFETSAVVGHMWFKEPRTTNDTRGFNSPVPHNSRALTLEVSGWAIAI